MDDESDLEEIATKIFLSLALAVRLSVPTVLNDLTLLIQCRRNKTYTVILALTSAINFKSSDPMPLTALESPTTPCPPTQAHPYLPHVNLDRTQFEQLGRL